MKRPTFSIVTPSFGQAAYLGEALESVRGQRYDAPVEHIVVDGASTDGTVELLKCWPADLRWVSEPDDGQSDALNKGFAMAKSDVIGWLNADDFYLPGALERVAEVFAARPDIDVVYGDCVFVDAEGRVQRSKNEHGFNSFVLTYFGCYIPSTSTFFRRRLFDRGQLLVDGKFHYVMDYELFLRLANGGARFAYVPAELAAFRWHDQNKSLNDRERLRERAEVQDLHHVRPRSRAGRSVMAKAARSVHLAMKAASGGLRKQRSWTRRRGEDVRWWNGSIES